MASLTNPRRSYHSTQLVFVICCLLVACCIKTSDSLAKVTITIEGNSKAIYDSLHDAQFDEARIYEIVPGTQWVTPLGVYTFESGTISFLQPVGGQSSGAYFKGKSRFVFDPIDALERHQLDRYCKDSILETSCDQFYTRYFDPNTQTQLIECIDTLTPSDRSPSHGKLRSYENDANKHLTLDIGARGWEMLINPSGATPWLYINPSLKGQGRLHFYYDATAHEPVTVWHRPKGVAQAGIVDLVCSYQSPDWELDSTAHQSLVDGGIDIQSYETVAELANSGDMQLNVAMECRARRNNISVLSFTMAPRLKIDSVYVNDAIAGFIYDDKGGAMLVQSPTPLHGGEQFNVQMHYHSDHLLEKLPWGDFYIRHTTRWLPRTAVRWRAHYTTTFQYPKFYEVVSVGNQVSDTIIDDTRISTWQSIGKVSYISFNYGSFDRLDHEMADGTTLRIYRGKNHRDGLFSSNYSKLVLEDIEGALTLFDHAFGDYPWSHLAATEIPGGHGQGFPQMLHLGYVSFQSDQRGITDAFRAHEVAHQWFGHIVGWKSYRDQWLSEGFAEYAGALFVQAHNEGNRDFLEVVKRWREQILERGGHTYWHDGPGVAPIALGLRCSSQRSPASYSHLVYGKGAYVLHMLRHMMRDYQRGNDDYFLAMMRDFVATYTDRDASTEDFRHIVEAHVHQPMDWFFNQWVYGTEIPRFEYQWSRDTLPDGQWIIHGQIDQFDTAQPFRIYMPITIDFGDNQKRTFVQLINSATTVFTTPALPGKPRNLTFNDFHTVLCKEKVVRKP